ncbi:hypothetical protein CC78DRAFT_574498 [Lojkania enalia]|uniref:Uncharacterized protein n=1 Tax=Lojkania enalia TaxID=147567 RepID=A0A9P4TQR6_9PLEO|nr:hypothetical protein CC78DRAFT_574498 [Didymosphaeria enalia]
MSYKKMNKASQQAVDAAISTIEEYWDLNNAVDSLPKNIHPTKQKAPSSRGIVVGIIRSHIIRELHLSNDPSQRNSTNRPPKKAKLSKADAENALKEWKLLKVSEAKRKHVKGMNGAGAENMNTKSELPANANAIITMNGSGTADPTSSVDSSDCNLRGKLPFKLDMVPTHNRKGKCRKLSKLGRPTPNANFMTVGNVASCLDLPANDNNVSPIDSMGKSRIQPIALNINDFNAQRDINALDTSDTTPNPSNINFAKELLLADNNYKELGINESVDNHYLDEESVSLMELEYGQKTPECSPSEEQAPPKTKRRPWDYIKMSEEDRHLYMEQEDEGNKSKEAPISVSSATPTKRAYSTSNEVQSLAQ